MIPIKSDVKGVGKWLSSSKLKYTWDMKINAEPVQVILFHSKISGKFMIKEGQKKTLFAGVFNGAPETFVFNFRIKTLVFDLKYSIDGFDIFLNGKSFAYLKANPVAMKHTNQEIHQIPIKSVNEDFQDRLRQGLTRQATLSSNKNRRPSDGIPLERHNSLSKRSSQENLAHLLQKGIKEMRQNQQYQIPVNSNGMNKKTSQKNFQTNEVNFGSIPVNSPNQLNEIKKQPAPVLMPTQNQYPTISTFLRSKMPGKNGPVKISGISLLENRGDYFLPLENLKIKNPKPLYVILDGIGMKD